MCIKNNKLYVINILFRYRGEIKSFWVRRGFIFRKDRIFNCMLYTIFLNMLQKEKLEEEKEKQFWINTIRFWARFCAPGLLLYVRNYYFASWSMKNFNTWLILYPTSNLFYRQHIIN